MGNIYKGIGTVGSPVGIVEGKYVHRATSGLVVATFDGQRHLHEGIGTATRCLATIDMGKYVHRGIGTVGPCLGTIDGRYVHQGIGTGGPCIGTIDSTDRHEQLAGGAALLLGLLEGIS